MLPINYIMLTSYLCEPLMVLALYVGGSCHELLAIMHRHKRWYTKGCSLQRTLNVCIESCILFVAIGSQSRCVCSLARKSHSVFVCEPESIFPISSPLFFPFSPILSPKLLVTIIHTLSPSYPQPSALLNLVLPTFLPSFSLPIFPCSRFLHTQANVVMNG